MTGRERIQEFIKEQEAYATGSKTEKKRKRYWDMATDLQLMLDVCNGAALVVSGDKVPADDWRRLRDAVNRLDREAMRDKGIW